MASQIKRQSEGAFFKPPRQFPKRDARGFPIGPRTERRQKENRKLGSLKIKHCEINIEGVCVYNKMLTWAHAVKSRFLVTSKDWQEAARSCLPCHMHIEALPNKYMKRLIKAAIDRRKSDDSIDSL